MSPFEKLFQLFLVIFPFLGFLYRGSITSTLISPKRIREYLISYMGSIPLDVPAIKLKVPVGVIVVVMAFLWRKPLDSHMFPL
jgi:hypothetical protein